MTFMPIQDILIVFLTHAAEVLAETSKGLSGNEIVKITAAYAVDHDVSIPYPTYPFSKVGLNKRSALVANLRPFSAVQQYQIIREMCDHRTIQASNKAEAEKLKVKLFTKYGHLDDGSSLSDVNMSLVDETRHWLDGFPDSLKLFEAAIQKHDHGVFTRNVLDDLRLSLESLLRSVLDNNKPLEKQLANLGTFIKTRGGSIELANMFSRLVDYYSKYQNSYVKHNDSVIEEEVEFILEITASFMKHILRIGAKAAE